MRVLRPAAVSASVLAVAIGVAACNSGSSSNSSSSGSSGSGSNASGSIKIGVTVSTLDNPFFVEFKAGVQAEAKKEGVSVTITNANNDSTQQANQMQDFVSQGDSAIIINPVDSNAAAPSVTLADRSKIPVIAADRAVTGASVKQTVAADNVLGGEYAAQQLAKVMNGKGQIVVLEGTPGTSAANERQQGFQQGIAKYPGIKVVAQQSANFDETDGLNVMTNLYQAHPGISGVFAANDEMGLGAVKALGSKAGHQIKVVAFDGTPEGLTDVENGLINVDIAQQPVLEGELSVEAAVEAAKGKSVAPTVAIPVKIVTKADAAKFLGQS